MLLVALLTQGGEGYLECWRRHFHLKTYKMIGLSSDLPLYFSVNMYANYLRILAKTILYLNPKFLSIIIS